MRTCEDETDRIVKTYDDSERIVGLKFETTGKSVSVEYHDPIRNTPRTVKWSDGWTLYAYEAEDGTLVVKRL